LESERIEGFQEFTEEIGTHVTKRGIITFTSKHRGTQKWDVEKGDNGELVFGVDKFQSLLFPAKLLSALYEGKHVGLILRTFTAERDESTGLPVKELRGYFVFLEGQRLRFRQSSAREIAEAPTTDHTTGKFLASERGVVYCGPNHDFLDDNLSPISK
jgi:hypothetical protein